MSLENFATSPRLVLTIRVLFLVALGFPLRNPTLALLSLASIAWLSLCSLKILRGESRRLILTRHLPPAEYEEKKRRLTELQLAKLEANEKFREMKNFFEKFPKKFEFFEWDHSPCSDSLY